MLPGDVAAVEYAPDGLRPFLGADLAVAGQVLTWRLVDVVPSDGLAATFVDEVTGLRVVLRWRFAAGTDVVERWAEVHNDGEAPVGLTRLGSAGFCVPTPSGATLSYLCGQWAQEFTPASTRLTRGRFEIGSAQGVTGHQFAPYLAVDNGDAVYGVALAWTGSWQITADTDAAGLTRVRVGRALDGAPVTLAPGDVGDHTGGGRCLQRRRARRAGPAVARVPARLGPARAAEGHLQLVGGHHLRRHRGRRSSRWPTSPPPWVSRRSWSTTAGSSAGRTTTAASATGRPTRPSSRTASAPSSRRSGRVVWTSGCGSSRRWSTPGPQLYAAHPDWVYQADGRPRSTIRNQYLLNLGRPDVYEFVLSTLDDLLARVPDLVSEVGLQPAAHRGGPVGRRPRRRARAQPLPHPRPPARGPPGRDRRGLRGRRRPGRPGDGGAHRRAVAQRQHRRRWTGCASSTASCPRTRRT